MLVRLSDDEDPELGFSAQGKEPLDKTRVQRMKAWLSRRMAQKRSPVFWLRTKRREMTLDEMYKKLGGDYNEVRLRIPSEALIRRFAVKFLTDTTFQDLTSAVEAKDWEKAFRAAHTMKGVALNLGFGALCRTSSELTEALRSREPLADMALLAAVKTSYDEAVEAIKAI